LKKYIIIVAGGIGRRMNGNIPKQFLLLKGKPVLFYTIEIFYKYSSDIPIILVLPQDQIIRWKELCFQYQLNIPHQIVEGGITRFHSVKNGLSEIKETCLVGIHDGARPLVSLQTISHTFEMAERKGNAVPVISVNESLRIVNEKGNQSINRETIKIIQTPQCFHSELIKKAYDQEYKESFTDDATVLETMGEKINLVEGNIENIKITNPIDLLFAENLITTL
jgi:2-C-methyl-D-erythritol 4-phosphate cytidylyltransferase